MIPLTQPCRVTIGNEVFCIGHGDGLGPGMGGYKFMRACFHNRTLQALFSTLHPWIANRIGKGWSKRSRLGKSIGYAFKGASEPLYRFCAGFNAGRSEAGEPPVDIFLFGHYHCAVDMPVGEARLLLLQDWISVSNWMVFDAGVMFWPVASIVLYSPKSTGSVLFIPFSIQREAMSVFSAYSSSVVFR